MPDELHHDLQFGDVEHRRDQSVAAPDVRRNVLHGLGRSAAGIHSRDEWTTAIQDQRYDLVLSTSAGSVLSTTGLVQYARSRWRKVFWDGSEPGGAGNYTAGMKVDYNLAYLIYSNLILPYDTSLSPSGSVVSSIVATFNANQTAGLEGMTCPAATLCGNLTLAMGGTGGRYDIGPLTGWDVIYLFTLDPSLRRVIEGNADIVGLMNLHYRESNASKLPYNIAGTLPSIGMTMSMDSRRTLSTAQHHRLCVVCRRPNHACRDTELFEEVAVR